MEFLIHDKSYTGPTIAAIRQDKPTENKVQQVIDALKHISPVFGQPSTPVSQVLPGISPLDQLKQQLSGQTNQFPNSFPPPLQKQPQDILGDLLHLHSNQFPLNQQPTQTLSNCHSPTQHQLNSSWEWQRNELDHPPHPPPPRQTFRALPGNLGSWFLVCNPILTQLEEGARKKVPVEKGSPIF